MKYNTDQLTKSKSKSKSKIENLKSSRSEMKQNVSYLYQAPTNKITNRQAAHQDNITKLLVPAMGPCSI